MKNVLINYIQKIVDRNHIDIRVDENTELKYILSSMEILEAMLELEKNGIIVSKIKINEINKIKDLDEFFV